MAETFKLEMPTLKEALEDCGGNEKLLEEQTHKIRLWLEQQLHLPRDISVQRLKFFISRSKFNLEKAKKCLDLYYTMRNIPEISRLDPLSDDIIQCYKYTQVIYLPELSPQNYRIGMARLTNSDSSVFEPNAVFKYVLLILEIIAEEDIVVSDILIIDMVNIRVGHCIKALSVYKRLNIYMEAHGRRIKAIHLINAPDYIDFIMPILKATLNAKIFNRIQVHTSGIESLYGIIPKSLFPADYGGEQPSMDNVTAIWHAKLAERREWFLEQEKVRADESLRSNSVKNPDDLFGVAGTFQKLDVD